MATEMRFMMMRRMVRMVTGSLLDRARVLLHGLETHFAVGAELGHCRFERRPVLLHSLEHNRAVGGALL